MNSKRYRNGSHHDVGQVDGYSSAISHSSERLPLLRRGAEGHGTPDPPSFSFPGHAAEGEANTVSGDFSLRKSSQKQSSKSKVIGGNSYQFAECITPNLGYKR